ncbi:ribonuclease domain-containing protein [Mycobacterium fragae]|uniref:ribonuclease domain-containing protein n=1 Tax=Mycobacterium fragae TaxID=1260918 RepID=UPI000A158337|nr:ribonuclease domain-containing protein [Mycobacterium fragae]
MPAVTGVPGLSALLDWPTEHLTEAADHWEAVGERSYGVAHQVWRDAMSADWQGEAAEALRTATHADMQTTSAVVDQLQAAASVARGGASDLDAARARVRYAVEDAHTAGFQVGEDLSVTDRMTGGSAAQRVARQAAAQAFAGDIRQRAAQLVGLDAQVAAKVTAAVAGVGNSFPQIPAPVAAPTGVRAFGNGTYKQDPPSPLPLDPKNMTADEARAAWAEVNAEIRAWNARCAVENVGLLPPAQYSACVASQAPLLERQAAIRARLGQLGIPIDGEVPASPGEPGGGGAGEPPIPQNVQDTLNQIDAGKWPGSANAPGTSGGGVFRNVTPSGQHPLPTTDASGKPITYQEWDVNPRVPGQDRDTERIITGSDGSAWYTTDHYDTFHRIR